jgi:Holliday junction DNA helicase RuvA
VIAQLKGELARTEADYVVIDVNGVGYKVHLPLSIMAQLPPVGNPTQLLIHTAVKEDSITLYGFIEDSEQKLFELLLTVNGVGPKSALNILSVIPVEQIVGAVSSDDHRLLSRVPGVGTKTAQRIVLDLKEKVQGWEIASRGVGLVEPGQRAAQDAVEGLIGLGYKRDDARAAIEEALKNVQDKQDAGGIVRAALKLLAKH